MANVIMGNSSAARYDEWACFRMLHAALIAVTAIALLMCAKPFRGIHAGRELSIYHGVVRAMSTGCLV